jgi:putative Ig domain-containing protein
VFPFDSDLGRTSGPPTFSTAQVPTRVNSPSDTASADRDSADGTLSYTASVVSATFTASNSVLNGIHPKPNQTTGGEGPVSGEEVQFNLGLSSSISLATGHYFFVPQVTVSSGDFFWLSASRPIVQPGTPFPTGSADLQSWIRNSDLDPDWLRVGTDIVGGSTPPTFNATFSLSGAVCSPISVSPTSLPNATAGQPYSASLTATGGTTPYRFTETGALPAGVSLAPNGTFSGAPAGPGSFPLVVTATDAEGCQGTAGMTLAVAARTSGGSPSPGGSPPPQSPSISSAHLSTSVFRAANRGASLAQVRRARVGTTISYRDSTAATTTFTVLKLVSGHKRGSQCVAGPAGKHQGRCTRRVRIGSFRHADPAGNVRVRFSGRVNRHKLKPGRYLLVLTPRANGTVGRAVTLVFRIVA